MGKKLVRNFWWVSIVVFGFYGNNLIAASPLSYISENTHRSALVIGNYKYRQAPLKNPKNDANDMAALLEKLQFSVSLHENLSAIEFENVVDVFIREVNKTKGVALLYYAGHAAQVQGKNYLIPIGSENDDILNNSVVVDEMLNQLSYCRNELNIVILDACRNNPFIDYFGNGHRSLRSIQIAPKSNGLAEISAPTGFFIAFATAPDRVASDGSETNGLYTKHLMKYLDEPGLSLEQVFKKVRIRVLEESEGEQIPWERSSLFKEFYFTSPPENPAINQDFEGLITNIQNAVNGGRHGVAYRQLKLAERIAFSEDEISSVESLREQIKRKLGVK